MACHKHIKDNSKVGAIKSSYDVIEYSIDSIVSYKCEQLIYTRAGCDSDILSLFYSDVKTVALYRNRTHKRVIGMSVC